ncbi:MAG: acyltransferase [Cyanobacteria bacterium J06560_2]
MNGQMHSNMLGNLANTTSKARKRTRVLTLLCGWIPLSIGVRIRNLIYRTIVRKMGHCVNIQTDVTISDGTGIEFADYVSISQGSILEASHHDQVVLGEHVFIDRDVRISSGKCGGRIHLQAGVSLDRGVDIKTHHHGQTVIGKNTYIGPYTCLSGYGNITIGSNCLIASHTSLYAHNYNFDNPKKLIREQGYSHVGITIGDNCWIGSGVRIVDGVKIGDNSIVGAGAVVARDIPPNSVAVGVPAKVVRVRSQQAITQRNFVAEVAEVMR